jgi:hypothetical protein
MTPLRQANFVRRRGSSVRSKVVRSTNDVSSWKSMLPGMDLTADRSALPHARGAVPAYYLDRGSAGGGVCLNAPTTRNTRENIRVDASNLKRGQHDLERSENR